MVDTVRTRSALAALLADNTAGDISAQDMRDFLASVPVINSPNEQTGSTYTFVLADADQTVIFNRASAQAITIPTNASIAFPVGTRIRCLRKGAGLPTIAPDVGVTLNKPTGTAPPTRIGALVRKTSDQTAANYTTSTAVTWDAEDYDDAAFHDTGSNTSRLSVPSGRGIKQVQLFGAIYTSSTTASLGAFVSIDKGGSQYFPTQISTNAAYGSWAIAIATPEVDVTAGTDYFELKFNGLTDTSITIEQEYSYFGIKVTRIDPVGSIAYQYGHVTIEKIGTDEWMIEGPALG